MRTINSLVVFAGLLVLALAGCDTQKSSPQLTDAQVENLVKRSYQYVAMYNVNNKFAMKLGRWNVCDADTKLKDHTMREIARPNNDTLYISCLVDLRKDPVTVMPRWWRKKAVRRCRSSSGN